MTTQIALIAAVAVLALTAVAYVVIGRLIERVHAVATTAPERLRGVTKQEALAKVEEWRRLRERLWPLGLMVAAGGFLVAGMN